MIEERTYIGDEQDDVIETKGFDHVGANHDTQTNSDRVHNHEHDHSSLEAMLVRTHPDDGDERMIAVDKKLLAAA